MTKSKEALNRLYGFCKGTDNYYRQFIDSGTLMERDMRLIEKELSCVEILRKLLAGDKEDYIRTYKEATYEEKEEIAKEQGLSVDEIDNMFEVLLNG